MEKNVSPQNLPPRYNPLETEDKWYALWQERGYFSASCDPAKKPFCIVIPPPNVTGILHMGHALNNTLQDILIRYHRMKGDSTLWMPGTDHAGIATQNVVEKTLAKQGLTRTDVGRDAFVDRVWQWKEQYGPTIIRQLKKLGASCDWERTRFTMDDEYSRAVLEVFVRLYEKGLIYQGSYIINWCPRCRTALADEEAPHREVKAHLYYIRYRLKESPAEYLTVATTRPETMLGDTAVAVNPDDLRYQRHVGRTVVLPLINREIKVIADPAVDREFGTGAVKVTPAHDRNDYALAKKHDLAFINIMHPDGHLNENAGPYASLERFAARIRILDDLEKQGLLEKVEPHLLSAGHCYRCHTITEPYLSKQWFVKMKPLAGAAIEAVNSGRITFHPSRWKKVYLNWMENIQDWCISRQIWWGHRLPVYYCDSCRQIDPARGVIVSRTAPQRCDSCGSTSIRQDEDVLDTWFSSWLWPFATFYWPFTSPDASSRKREEELRYFYPTGVLITAPEIIFFWVARMIMAGCEFMKQIPFRDVYIHGTVRDVEGKKMSKSLGNIIDPLEIIQAYGTDALRFSLVAITAQGQDVYLSKERFEQGRNFANKIWNAARLIMLNCPPALPDVSPPKPKEDDIINRWIMGRLSSVIAEVTDDLDRYRFNEAANLLYSFIWHEFCDWYLEAVKPVMADSTTQAVMHHVLERTLRLLHPFMPFLTEEIWQKVLSPTPSIMIAPWPQPSPRLQDVEAEAKVKILFELIEAIRMVRSDLEFTPDTRVTVSVYPHRDETKALIMQHKGLLVHLARLTQLTVRTSPERPAATASALSNDTDLYVHFEGLIDTRREQERIAQRLLAETKRCESKQALLDKADFVSKAQPHVVENIKRELTETQHHIQRYEKLLRELA